MKKSVLISLCLALCLAVALSGTIAYLTDVDTAVNVMTLGSVGIKVEEFQRDGEGGLKDFQQMGDLYPAVGEIPGAVDAMNLPTNPSFVDKIVQVTSTSRNASAFLRVYIGVPSALLNVKGANGTTMDAVHLLMGSQMEENWPWAYDHTVQTKIDGVPYDMLCYQYTRLLAPGETTAPVLSGLWLDSMVGNRNGGYTLRVDGRDMPLDFDIANGLQITILAQAIQAENFTDLSAGYNDAHADAAFQAGGMNNVDFDALLDLENLVPSGPVNQVIQLIAEALQRAFEKPDEPATIDLSSLMDDQQRATLDLSDPGAGAEMAEIEAAFPLGENVPAPELRVDQGQTVTVLLGDNALPKQITVAVEDDGTLYLIGADE